MKQLVNDVSCYSYPPLLTTSFSNVLQQCRTKQKRLMDEITSSTIHISLNKPHLSSLSPKYRCNIMSNYEITVTTEDRKNANT